jgi:N-methylhydantoinase B
MVMDHGRTGPLGALGGTDGGVNRVAVETRAGSYQPPHLSKDQDIQLEPGDVVRVSTPGGGGYGDPLRRDPRKVASDVRRGYYTRDQAASLFGVALDAAGEVDGARTEQLRSGRRSRAA